MADNLRLNNHGERIMKLETRMDSHQDSIEDMRKDLKIQTRQIFMGMGGLGVLVFIIELLFRTNK